VQDKEIWAHSGDLPSAERDAPGGNIATARGLEQARQVLNGLRVLDLSNGPAGAQATQTLADFGAEVVHIEPAGGSGLRAMASYPFLARGKKSMVADLHDPGDQATVRTLALGADVLVESFRPGVVERFGLGYEQLRQENPGWSTDR